MTSATGAGPDPRHVLVVGNSDGIGLALTGLLLDEGWRVSGVSRRPCPLLGDDAQLVHDVRAPGYREALAAHLARRGAPAVCVWCVGVGEPLEDDLRHEAVVLETNLLAAVVTAEVVLPPLLAAGRGHFLGLSSLADLARIPGAPSYSASKAGLTSWLEALGLACRPRGVAVTNLRFGFVDTKMAQARWKPFLMSAERAARHVRACLDDRPLRRSRPRVAALLMRAAAALVALRFGLF